MSKSPVQEFVDESFDYEVAKTNGVFTSKQSLLEEPGILGYNRRRSNSPNSPFVIGKYTGIHFSDEKDHKSPRRPSNFGVKCPKDFNSPFKE